MLLPRRSAPALSATDDFDGRLQHGDFCLDLLSHLEPERSERTRDTFAGCE